MIAEDYVSFETAKLLKEKGFKGLGDRFYEKGRIIDFNNYWWRITPKERYDSIEAPTLQMAMKWLRECKNIIVNIWWTNGDDTAWGIQYLAPIPSNPKVNHFVFIGDGYKTYEEACESAIKYCLENLI